MAQDKSLSLGMIKNTRTEELSLQEGVLSRGRRDNASWLLSAAAVAQKLSDPRTCQPRAA